jgi:hypothetical protein
MPTVHRKYVVADIPVVEKVKLQPWEKLIEKVSFSQFPDAKAFAAFLAVLLTQFSKTK